MSSNFQTIAVERRLIDKLLIKEMVFVLVFSVLLQVLIHLIPSGNVPAGAYLLPLFYAPFIAVLFFRLQVGIVVALLSPLCNYLITGNPVPELLGVITIELVAFVLLSKLLSNYNITRYIKCSCKFYINKSIFFLCNFAAAVFICNRKCLDLFLKFNQKWFGRNITPLNYQLFCY